MAVRADWNEIFCRIDCVAALNLRQWSRVVNVDIAGTKLAETRRKIEAASAAS
jgi:hypothetical protein